MLIIKDRAIGEATSLPFEVVERKGIGHPDSMADLVAEEFSLRYSLSGLERFGAVPNHWVDKVALIGAAANVTFGGYKIAKPISAYLFGKVTPSVGDEALPIADLFESTVRDVLAIATGDESIAANVRCLVENTSGVAMDHPRGFYRPSTAGDYNVAISERRANDTSFCTAYAPATVTERLAIALENFVNDAAFRDTFPLVGSDVKVMVTRVGDHADVTMCLPFHPERTPTFEQYRSTLAQAETAVRDFAEQQIRAWAWDGTVSLALNTKDRNGGAYLAPFGTSLGKGDCGLVGRGNKSNGVIPAVRCTGVEAMAGKNPMHHTGKLYTLAAMRIADRVNAELGLSNETVLLSRNGHLLSHPAFVGVRLAAGSTSSEQKAIGDIVDDVLSNLDLLSKWLLTTSVINRFRRPALNVEG
ncbi:methionine adenosyltransferase [Dactylosporangium sp. CA-152071]|uniref:methionine adenosyltransferase n=1 Tax=Dactylosporangium sp. CA-152071 TaxID=3239933 RepID=UPI003D9138B5